MLASEIVTRTFEQWLYPAGINRPAWDYLVPLGMGSTLQLTADVSGRLKNIPRDSVVEIDYELLLVDTTAGSHLIFKAPRGYAGTTAATHAGGAILQLDPRFPKQSVLDRIKELVQQLYGKGLYRRLTDNSTTFDISTTKSLPAGGLRVLNIVADRSDGPFRLKRGRDYVDFPEFSPASYRLYSGAASGATLHVFYAADFDLVTDQNTNLDSIGIPASLQPHLAMGAAGLLLQGQEGLRLNIDEIRRLVASSTAGVQVGASLNVGRTLSQAFDQVVATEFSKLQRLDPITFEYSR